MKARRILWIYCVFASLVLAAWLVAIVATSGPLRTASAAASVKLQRATDEADAQNDKVTRFEDEQRAKRAQLSAEDAIKFSAEIQTEQALLDELNTARDAAQAGYTSASHAYQNHMGRLVPVIALIILHIVGSMLFWPRPEISRRK